MVILTATRFKEHAAKDPFGSVFITSDVQDSDDGFGPIRISVEGFYELFHYDIVCNESVKIECRMRSNTATGHRQFSLKEEKE